MISALVIAAFGVAQGPSCCPSMNAFLADPAFIAAHKAPLPFKFQSGEGHAVSFSDATGAKASGYYVEPKDGSDVAVIMVHEWWGLNDYIKHEAVSLHDQTGYGVLAVDLYDGKVAATPQQAGEYMGAVKPDHLSAIVKGAVNALVNGEHVKKAVKIGTIGWCFGGGWSLQTAIEGGSHVKACVMFYGMPDTKPDDLAKLEAPVLMIEALKDQWITPKVVNAFQVAMANMHKSLVVKTYEADHGFANPSGQRYDAEAAKSAMALAVGFLKGNLGG